MKMIQNFDPSAAASGTFKHQIANPCGGVYLFNESNVWIQLTLPDGGNVGLPAWWARFYKLENVQGPIEWQALATISSVASPLSQVYGESYERSEIVGRTFYDGPIPRNPFIGNQVSSSVSTTSVQNDGNPTVTTFVEATQVNNSGGSNVALGNDGSALFAQWVSSIYTKLFQILPGANPEVDIGALTKLTARSSVNNGDTSGTQTLYEAIYGGLKVVIVYQNNYKQAGGAFHNILQTNFAIGAAWFNMGCGGLGCDNGGSALVSNQITWGTGTSAGSSAGGTGMPSFAAGIVNSAISHIGDSGGYVSAHTGLGIFIGL